MDTYFSSLRFLNINVTKIDSPYSHLYESQPHLLPITPILSHPPQKSNLEIKHFEPGCKAPRQDQRPIPQVYITTETVTENCPIIDKLALVCRPLTNQ